MKSMPLQFGGRVVEVFGGPYVERPAHMTGVKLAVEINEPCDVDLPVRDYSVPDVGLAQKAIRECLGHMMRGQSLYVGCWGGKGRTGLFMAILAKAAGVSDPVAYVRSTFNEHAVETPEQEAYVRDFPVGMLKWAYRAASFSAQKAAPAAPSSSKPGP